MQIAFVTWVSPISLRWHLRFFRYQFISCLKTAGRLKKAEVTVHIGAIGLPDHVIEIIEQEWASCPIPVKVISRQSADLPRHTLVFRPYNRIAGLDPAVDNPDYIVSLHPNSSFAKDAIHDYLDTCVQMQAYPELGCVIHTKNGTPHWLAPTDRNGIVEDTRWVHHPHENVVFRNLENLHPDYNYFYHHSVDVHDRYYLEGVVAIYSGMFEGWGIGVRGYSQATVYDPVHRPGQPDHMSNCFGRMRGDNWESSFNGGWRHSPDKAFFSQIVYPEEWEQNWKYLRNLQMRPAFYEIFRKKQKSLKNTVAPAK